MIILQEKALIGIMPLNLNNEENLNDERWIVEYLNDD
jgi:hypothetical protein